MKTERHYKVTLDYDHLSEKYGFDLPLNEWGKFCQVYETYFKFEAEETLLWVMEEWNTLKNED